MGGGGSGVLGPEGGRFGIDPGRTGSEAFLGGPSNRGLFAGG
jgi:hypothetical protein